MYVKSKWKLECLVLILLGLCRVVFCQHYPVWQSPTGGVTMKTIQEDTPVGTSLYDLVATDVNGDTLVYTIRTGAKFTLDSQILKTNAILDRENDGDTITLVFRVQESVSIYRYATDVTAYISLTDVNDNPPTFSPAVYVVSVAENTGSGSVLTTLTCSDADSGNNAAYSLAIASGDDTTNKFTLSGTQLRTTASALNYEDLSGRNYKYTLVVTATETLTSSPTFTGTAYVIVQVTAVNEFTPSITGTSPSTVSIAENVGVGTTVCQVIGSDSDDEPEGNLQFTIRGGSGNNGDLAIDRSSGKIYTVKNLDFETKTSYQLYVEVKDAASSPRSSTYTFTVTITDVNDNTPECTQYFHSVGVSETVSSGSTVVSLSCSDDDAGTTLSYSISSGNTDSTFSVSSAGVVTTATALDYDSGTTSYRIEVQVSDGTYSTTVTVGVTLTAVNEDTPSFVTNPLTVSINEDKTIGSEILTYAASDTDASPHDIVDYAITSVSNSGSSKFIIDKVTGTIHLAQQVDYETYTSYVLKVVATDGGSSQATGTVTVSILDVNDNSPVCSPFSHAVTVNENAATSYEVISDLSCTDADSGSNGNLNYVLTVNPDSKFTITESSGVYKVTVNAALDYESASFYQLEVTVSDNGSPSLSTVVSIDVSINDISEASPVFSSSGQYSANFGEDASIGTTIVTVAASDADTNDVITYGFDTTYANFSVDPTSGVILLTNSLDYEGTTSHTLLVTAADGTNTVTGTVSVTVNDVNEYPIFVSATYSANIDENISVGTSVTQVSAIDSDSGSLGTVTYSFQSGDGTSMFTVNSATGIVTTSSSIDYEEQNIYYLVVQATDGGSPSLTSTCLVVIKINDLNDNAPVFELTTYTMSISEDTATSVTIVTVVASDADSSTNNNNVFGYTLTTSTPFSVGTSTGEITTNAVIDRETTSSYDLVIVATDQGSPAQTTSYTLTISLVDVNDNTPTITGTYDTTINEDTGMNILIFTVAATDSDSGDNGRLSYNITSGNDNNEFRIDNGYIQTAASYDRETADVYTLEVTVADNGSPALITSVTATVTIGDVNDNYPLFVSNFTFSIEENATISTIIGTLNATDSDDGNNSALVYSIAGYWGTGVNPFTIEGSTGIISTSSSLDRETKDTYNLWCRVSDSGSPLLSSDMNITISIDDFNDNHPVFGSSTYTGSVAEAAENGTSVVTVATTDADLGESADISVYSINTSDSNGAEAGNYFNIDSLTGVVSIVGETDRETKSTYSFYVNAVDNGTNMLTSSVSVQITITDINDNIPVFSPVFYNSEVPYLVLCSSSITTLTASDADSGSNAVISFFNEASDSVNFDTYFTLDSSTGQLSLKDTLTSNSKYVLTFGARDSGSPQLTSNVSATVRVDTYTPGDVVLVFYMSISQSVFTSLETTFLSQLTVIYQQSYTSCTVKRWCTEEVTTSSIKVNIFIITDNSTELSENTGQSKNFLAASTAQLFVATSNGTPSAAIIGSNWDNFSITQVLIYDYVAPTTDDTPWIETLTGILVVTSASFGGIVLIIIVTCIIVKTCRANESQAVKENEGSQIIDDKDEYEHVNGISSAKSGSIDRDDDLVSAVLYRNPAIITKTTDQLNVTKTSSKIEKKEKFKPEATVVPVPYKFKLDLAKFRKDRFEHAQRRNLDLDMPTKADPDVTVVNNRKFDGKAVDPATGRIYEYNTKTHERRWVETQQFPNAIDF